MKRTACPALVVVLLLGLPLAAHGPPPVPRTQVRFASPSGMQIRWYFRTPDGKDAYSDPPLEAPARYSFRQGGLYRLKLTHIRGFPGLELYPTLEVPLAHPSAQEFLAHSSVPFELTDDDFRQVTDGKQVVKKVHAPSDGGAAPGPVVLVIRIGNLDLEAPGAKKE